MPPCSWVAASVPSNAGSPSPVLAHLQGRCIRRPMLLQPLPTPLLCLELGPTTSPATHRRLLLHGPDADADAVQRTPACEGQLVATAQPR